MRTSSRTATTTWSATPATRRGPRAAAAATCRSRRTGRPSRNHYEGGETRNYATYNPQVARDDMFMLGRRGPTEGQQDRAGALVLGAGAVVDERQPRAHLHPAAADRGVGLQLAGVRTRTIRTPSARPRPRPAATAISRRTATTTPSWRSRCGYGTNSSTSSASTRRSATSGSVTAVQVTEWDEPQAVIGSYLHRYAYPDWYQRAPEAQEAADERGQCNRGGVAQCLQLRGEYLYVAEGDEGHARLRRREHRATRASPRGSSPRRSRRSARTRTSRRRTRPAWCCRRRSRSHPARNEGDLMRVTNLEQPFHPIYNYARDHGCGRGPDPHRRQHAGRRRVPQQLPEARA